MISLNFREYEILKENELYKIIIAKKEKEIIIKCNNYYKSFNIQDLSLLFEYSSNTIDECYKFIINIFNKNKVFIKNRTDESLSLIFEKSNGKQKIIVNLISKSQNYNDFSKLTVFKDITNDSYTCFFNYTFILFKTINKSVYLLYININGSIICFDLYKQQKVTEIKPIKKENTVALRHYLDEKNKTDLIIAISPTSVSLRIWDVKNWQCLYYINKAYNNNILYSACLLFENNDKFVITSNCNYFGDSEPILIFDFKGNKIKEINESNDATLLVDVYYDKRNSKIYIITGNKSYLKSFDYQKNMLYHKYYENYNGAHFKFIVHKKKEVINLIESCEDGNIRIWNFHSGILLNKIFVSQQSLYDITLWNDNELLVGCQDKAIKIVDLENSQIKKILRGHNNYVITIQKINHILYGECLISHGFDKDQIKIWIFKD